MLQTILLLSDNALKSAGVRKLLAEASDAPFITEWIKSCAATLARLRDRAQQDIAAILIDLLQPGRELEIFDQIFEAAPHIPILVLTNPEREEVAKQTVQRGAQDYILDDRLDRHSLLKALHNMLERTAISIRWLKR
jgi:DNA-binding NarL/FixJ family response regulator